MENNSTSPTNVNKRKAKETILKNNKKAKILPEQIVNKEIKNNIITATDVNMSKYEETNPKNNKDEKILQNVTEKNKKNVFPRSKLNCVHHTSIQEINIASLLLHNKNYVSETKLYEVLKKGYQCGLSDFVIDDDKLIIDLDPAFTHQDVERDERKIERISYIINYRSKL